MGRQNRTGRVSTRSSSRRAFRMIDSGTHDPPRPVIAKVHGVVATAAGCQLVASCRNTSRSLRPLRTARFAKQPRRGQHRFVLLHADGAGSPVDSDPKAPHWKMPLPPADHDRCSDTALEVGALVNSVVPARRARSGGAIASQPASRVRARRSSALGQARQPFYRGRTNLPEAAAYAVNEPVMVDNAPQTDDGPAKACRRFPREKRRARVAEVAGTQAPLRHRVRRPFSAPAAFRAPCGRGAFSCSNIGTWDGVDPQLGVLRPPSLTHQGRRGTGTGFVACGRVSYRSPSSGPLGGWRLADRFPPQMAADHPRRLVCSSCLADVAPRLLFATGQPRSATPRSR